MVMTRTIHAIGQGAFYTECFEHAGENINIVFDCGSGVTNTKLIDSEISQTFKKDEEILAVFISHFHSDHINGLKKLLKHCTVHYVFLPVLSNESKLLYLYNEDDYKYDPLENLKNAIHASKKSTKIIMVSLQDAEERNDNNRLVLDKNISKNKISSGTKITVNYEWEYIPFNLNHTELSQRIHNAFGDAGEPIPDATNMTLEDFHTAKKIFEKVIHPSEDKNANSMVLYSGASDKTKCLCRVFPQHFCWTLGWSYPSFYCGTGCIYTGDFDLQATGCDILHNAYKNVRDNVEIIQIPHHGSIYNFNKSLLDNFPYTHLFFISAGEKNSYRHPSSTVVASIVKSNRLARIVTEGQSSRLQFIYV